MHKFSDRHVWQLDDHDILLEAHVEMEEDIPVSYFDTLVTRIEEFLKEEGIIHVNIQPDIRLPRRETST